MNVYVFLVLTLSTWNVSGIGVFLDKIKTTVDTVKCGAHRIGNAIYGHGHDQDICQENQYEESVATNYDQRGQYGVDIERITSNSEPQIVSTEKQVDKSSQISEITTEQTKVTSEGVVTPTVNLTSDSNSTNPSNNATERRILSNVKTNCPKGQVADEDGTCRETF